MTLVNIFRYLGFYSYQSIKQAWIFLHPLYLSEIITHHPVGYPQQGSYEKHMKYRWSSSAPRPILGSSAASWFHCKSQMSSRSKRSPRCPQFISLGLGDDVLYLWEEHRWRRARESTHSLAEEQANPKHNSPVSAKPTALCSARHNQAHRTFPCASTQTLR